MNRGNAVSEGTLLIRADATRAMGTGHVMRCLALTQSWQDAGGSAVFAMANPGTWARGRLLKESVETSDNIRPAWNGRGCITDD